MTAHPFPWAYSWAEESCSDGEEWRVGMDGLRPSGHKSVVASMAVEPTEPERTAMNKLDEDLRCMLVNAKVPYDVIAAFANLEYVSLDDFTDFFSNKEKVKIEGPVELSFASDSNGYTAATSKRAGIRLAQAWDIARATYEVRKSALAASGTDQNKLICTGATREHMENLWSASHGGAVPALDLQGSDT